MELLWNTIDYYGVTMQIIQYKLCIIKQNYKLTRNVLNKIH